MYLFALSFGQRHSKSLADMISGTVLRTFIAGDSVDFLNTDWIWMLNLFDWYGESLVRLSRSTMRPITADLRNDLEGSNNESGREKKYPEILYK